MTKKQTAIYVRVSTTGQDTKSQIPDLKSWACGREGVVWYRDQASGKNMDRPGWSTLERAIYAGKTEMIVVWRIDRLGRTARPNGIV